MVLLEIVGLIGAVLVGAVVLKVSRVYGTYRMYGADSTKTDTVELITKPENAEFHFKFNDLFELSFKSKSQARFVQFGLLVILCALAFLIVTFGLKNLGIGV